MSGGLEEYEDLLQFGLKSFTPVLDRYSPLSYSIADYIHRITAKHAGYENCYRTSLCHVFIIQGSSLFREIAEDCIKCKMLRGKYIEASMSPISDHQLNIAPPFYVAMGDLMGPVTIYAPGHSQRTRNTNAIQVKAYILAVVCPTTKCVNLQVLEGKGADAICEGIIRVGCEVGMPSFYAI